MMVCVVGGGGGWRWWLLVVVVVVGGKSVDCKLVERCVVSASDRNVSGGLSLKQKDCRTPLPASDELRAGGEGFMHASRPLSV